MIEFKNITKKFNKHYALKNINLLLKEYQTTVIIGSSGSGKSTLLRIINNLENPTSGSIFIRGIPLTDKNHYKLCLKIGMVFQQFHLFPHMNILKNLTYAPQVVFNNPNLINIKKKAQELLKSFGIEEKLYSTPNELSGGEKQKIAICRALMMNPNVMLFDEPTSALDPEAIQNIAKIIHKLKSQMTIIIVTHQINFAKIIADRIIFMNKGTIVTDQPAKAFFKNSNSHKANFFLSV